jgi:hypothetical protein
VRAIADVDLDLVPDVPQERSQSTGALLQSFDLAVSASDAVPPALSEVVTTHAWEHYTGADSFTVRMIAPQRSVMHRRRRSNP